MMHIGGLPVYIYMYSSYTSSSWSKYIPIICFAARYGRGANDLDLLVVFKYPVEAAYPQNDVALILVMHYWGRTHLAAEHTSFIA